MKINITARHFRAKDSLQKYANEKLGELEKYNENILHSEVIYSYDKPPLNIKYCEIIIKLRDKLITCKEGTDDFVTATDKALEKIEIQLYKYKDKIKSKRHTKPKEN